MITKDILTRTACSSYAEEIALVVIVVPNVTGKVGTYSFESASDDEALVDDYLTYSTLCGNGILEAGEECDDGNTVNGDGCENDCTTSSVALQEQITLFVTSSWHDGNLKEDLADGITGANTVCQTRAGAAGLDGAEHYRALLSTTNLGAFWRIPNRDLAVYNVNGELLSPSAKTMFRGVNLPNRILTETGNLASGCVWTGSDKNGALFIAWDGSRQDCRDWTRDGSWMKGMIGVANSLNDNWISTERHIQYCGGRWKCMLYCFKYVE